MKTTGHWLHGMALLLLVPSAQAESPPVMDSSKLPPSAAKKVEFARDIKPMLENAAGVATAWKAPRAISA